MGNTGVTGDKPMLNKLHPRRLHLCVYDAVLLLLADLLVLGVYPSGSEQLPVPAFAYHTVLAVVCVAVFRLLTKVYKQVWRYGGSAR